MDELPGLCLLTRVIVAFSRCAFLGVGAAGCLIVGIAVASGGDGLTHPRMSDEGLDAQALSAQSIDAARRVARETGHTLCTRGTYSFVVAQPRNIEHLEDLLGCGLPPDQARMPESMLDEEVVSSLEELERWHRQWGSIPGETFGMAGIAIAGGFVCKLE